MSANYNPSLASTHGHALLQVSAWWFMHRQYADQSPPATMEAWGGTYAVDFNVPGVNTQPYGAVMDDFGDLVRVAKP
jgi:hypothetical protein